MEFLVLLFVGWIVWTIVGAAAKNAKAKQLPPPAFWDPSQIPPEHVLQLGAPPAAVLPPRGGVEESSSELMWDELAGDTELDYSTAEAVSLEPTDVAVMSVEARPLPAAAVTLEHEVDWEAEHEIFHRKYVDGHSTGSAARHGLMDELRDPAVLRRAVLMGEILGPPKSLRK